MHVALLAGCINPRFHDLTDHDVVDNYDKIELEIHELAEKKLKCYSLEYTHIDGRHTDLADLDYGFIEIEAKGCGKRAVFTAGCWKANFGMIGCTEIKMEIIKHVD